MEATMTAKGVYVPMTPAQRWGSAVLRSRKRRGLTEAQLAAASGVAEVTLATWRKGQAFANLHQGMDVAAALRDDRLETLILELRTRTCTACGASFVAIRSPDARFCARSNCRASQRQEKRNARHIEERREVQRSATISLRVIQQTVDAYCWECEPEGTCRTPECKLRGVSPLRLEPRLA